MKISGYLEEGKENEFRQTMQFVSNHLPHDCIGHHLASDVAEAGLYHFYLLWSSCDSLKHFTRSHEFDLIRGAFKTLGTIKDTMAGKKFDLSLFDLYLFDSNIAD